MAFVDSDVNRAVSKNMYGFSETLTNRPYRRDKRTGLRFQGKPPMLVAM